MLHMRVISTTRWFVTRRSPALIVAAVITVVAGTPLAPLAAAPAPAPSAPPAPAVPAAPAPLPSVFDLIPGDADLAVVFDNAAEFRRTGLVDSALSLLDPDGLLGPIRKAWPELATQLGWTSDEAFDALLGTRVVLTIVSDASTAPAASSGKSSRTTATGTWALLSHITPDAERRLMTRMTANPRGLVEGHQILALPDGKFFYTLHHNRAGKPAPQTGDGGWVVIGPSERAWLMYSVISQLRAADRGTAASTASLSSTASAAIESLPGRAEGEAPVQMLLRLDNRHETETGHADPHITDSHRAEWRDFLALTARNETTDDTGTRWRLDIVLRERERAAALARQPLFSDAPLRRMTAYAPLAAVVQASTRGQNAAAFDDPHAKPITTAEDTLAGVLTALGLNPREAGEGGAMHGRQALLVEAQPVAAPQPLATPTTTPPPVPAITLAIEIRADEPPKNSRLPGLAAKMDASVAKLVSTLEQRFGVNPSPPPRDFAGVFPEAPRVLPLNFETDNPISVLFGGRPVLCWSYPGSETTHADDDGPCMWWAITASRGVEHTKAAAVSNTALVTPHTLAPAEFHRRAIEALTTENSDHAQTDRWLSLGFVQPSALEPLLPAFLNVIGDGTWRQTLTHIRLLEWRTRATDAGDIAGEFGVVIDDTVRQTENTVKKK